MSEDKKKPVKAKAKSKPKAKAKAKAKAPKVKAKAKTPEKKEKAKKVEPIKFKAKLVGKKFYVTIGEEVYTKTYSTTEERDSIKALIKKTEDKYSTPNVNKLIAALKPETIAAEKEKEELTTKKKSLEEGVETSAREKVVSGEVKKTEDLKEKVEETKKVVQPVAETTSKPRSGEYRRGW